MMTVVSLRQKSRDVNRDLQVQLDHVLQQAQDPNSRGNSLFAEVKETSTVNGGVRSVCTWQCARVDCVSFSWRTNVLRWRDS